MRRAPRLSPPARIPAASMADIAFLLLIFFLTSAIFRIENGLDVDLPRVGTAEGSVRQRTTHIWVDTAGRIAIDDAVVPMASLEGILAAKLARSGEIIVNLQVDRSVSYETVDRLLTQIKKANIRNVVFGTEPQAGGP